MKTSVTDVNRDDIYHDYDYLEDILMGNAGSYCSVHIDHPPCVGSRVTVLEGRKEIAAWPFDPDIALPSNMPRLEILYRKLSIAFTVDKWANIKECALNHGGWVESLEPGK